MKKKKRVEIASLFNLLSEHEQNIINIISIKKAVHDEITIHDVICAFVAKNIKDKNDILISEEQINSLKLFSKILDHLST